MRREPIYSPEPVAINSLDLAVLVDVAPDDLPIREQARGSGHQRLFERREEIIVLEYGRNGRFEDRGVFLLLLLLLLLFLPIQDTTGDLRKDQGERLCGGSGARDADGLAIAEMRSGLG